MRILFDVKSNMYCVSNQHAWYRISHTGRLKIRISVYFKFVKFDASFVYFSHQCSTLILYSIFTLVEERLAYFTLAEEEEEQEADLIIFPSPSGPLGEGCHCYTLPADDDQDL